LSAPEGERLTALFQWADGVEPRYDNALHAESYGRLAAALHEASDGFPSDASRPRLDIEGWLDTPLQQLRPAIESRPDVAKYLDGLAKRIRTRLSGLDEECSAWGFCHGDLHCGNVRLDEHALTLIDFDCCGTGWRAGDLATFRWAARLRGFEQVAWPPFVDAYLTLRPQARAWIGQVLLFVIMRQLWLMGLRVANSPETGAEFFLSGAFAERLMEFCQHVESQDTTD
jgi:Ser/Thr protein kinase RdoA (MazF antagonist)